MIDGLLAEELAKLGWLIEVQSKSQNLIGTVLTEQHSLPGVRRSANKTTQTSNSDLEIHSHYALIWPIVKLDS